MSLKGKRVLVTRSRTQASKLVQSLQQAGAIAVEVPVIHFEPPKDMEAFRNSIHRVDEYQWIIFTSINGVSAFFDEMARQNRTNESLNDKKFAAIGPATAEALKRKGLRVDVMPAEYRGEAVAQAMIDKCQGNLSDISILLPRAAKSRPALPDMLRHSGARVDVIDAYRTVLPDDDTVSGLRKMLQEKQLDVATFTSSSTVEHTLKILGPDGSRLLAGLTIASIGPITTQTAQDRGLSVDVTAAEYTIEGLVDALSRYFSQNQQKG